uniref:Uncharacterized protein n=1 Tax=Melicertus latisulcatus majanivirus TaxID=2984277 RepID=A0A9C7BM39_9VIRU|nr:MAG: hypothetical protein [Melicertus latisulcatus majanivirus]
METEMEMEMEMDRYDHYSNVRSERTRTSSPIEAHHNSDNINPSEPNREYMSATSYDIVDDEYPSDLAGITNILPDEFNSDEVDQFINEYYPNDNDFPNETNDLYSQAATVIDDIAVTTTIPAAATATDDYSQYIATTNDDTTVVTTTTSTTTTIPNIDTGTTPVTTMVTDIPKIYIDTVYDTAPTTRDIAAAAAAGVAAALATTKNNDFRDSNIKLVIHSSPDKINNETYICKHCMTDLKKRVLENNESDIKENESTVEMNADTKGIKNDLTKMETMENRSTVEMEADTSGINKKKKEEEKDVKNKKNDLIILKRLNLGKGVLKEDIIKTLPRRRKVTITAKDDKKIIDQNCKDATESLTENTQDDNVQILSKKDRDSTLEKASKYKIQKITFSKNNSRKGTTAAWKRNAQKQNTQTRFNRRKNNTATWKKIEQDNNVKFFPRYRNNAAIRKKNL